MFGQKNPEINIKELLSVNKYYNIAALFLAAKEHVFEPIKEIFGELGAFTELKETTHYSRFLKNLGVINMYPIGLGHNKIILRPHSHVVAASIAGYDSIAYMQTNEPGPNYGDSWVEKLNTKELLISYYPKLLSELK